MKLLDFVIIKLTIVLILGIVFGAFFTISNHSLYFGFGLSLFIFILVYIFSLKSTKKTIWFALLAYFITFLIGIASVNFHNEKDLKRHYTQILPTSPNNTFTLIFRIKEQLKPGNYYNKYIVDLLEVNHQNVIGKVLLNIKKDSINHLLQVDDIYATKANLKEVTQPFNPYQFNYKKYLNKQYIYHQVFNNRNNLLKLDSQHKTTIYGVAFNIRHHINQKLKTYHFNPNVLAITNALLLGQRQNISKDIYSHYTKAGAVHILAVSGLHVGIVLLILNFILRPLEYLNYGSYLKIVIILCCLWSFAIIAGLSASVVRAVTMFTAVAIALNLKKPTNVYNILFISAFVLLLIKPMFLFDVGFQLSYIAVIAIVSFQPVFYKLYKPKWRLDELAWNITTVSFAAQLGVAPIALYYFHQFPGLFFISNLVIIPFLGCILGLGILVMALASVNITVPFLAKIYSWFISSMNNLVAWVSRQEAFIFDQISFELPQVFATYFVIIASYFLITSKNKPKYSIVFLISILVLQLSFIYVKHNNNYYQFTVFHKSRQSIIGYKTNHKLTIHHSLKNEDIKTLNLIRDYKIGSFISKTQYNSIKPIYQVNNKLLLVVDSLGVYNTSFKPEIILLRNSPKINLPRLIDSIKPKLIIADGSNYKSYIERWKLTCKKQKLPFHNTNEKGAFTVMY